MNPAAGLDARLFVRADEEILLGERPACPASRVKIEHPGGPAGKRRVTGRTGRRERPTRRPASS